MVSLPLWTSCLLGSFGGVWGVRLYERSVVRSYVDGLAANQV